MITDEQRATTVRLYEAERAAYQAWKEARQKATALPEWQALEAEIDALQKQLEALEDKQEQIGGVAQLNEAHIAASEAYVDDPFAVKTEWDDEMLDETPVRCAASGKIILCEDDIVEDPDTGEIFLRGHFVPLPAQEQEAAA